MRRLCALAASAVLWVQPANAATLLVDAGGNLIGANDVLIDGRYYNVSFDRGTCEALFSGCNELTDFGIGSEHNARIASVALLDQVLIDGPAGLFDSESTLIRGCSLFPSFCNMAIPYDPGPLPTSQVEAVTIFNYPGAAPDYPLGAISGLKRGLPFTYAAFTRSSTPGPVPEPSTWALMLLGFGFVGAAMRSRGRQRQRRLHHVPSALNATISRAKVPVL